LYLSSTPPTGVPSAAIKLTLYNELNQEFADLDASVIAISVDGIWCHLALAADRKYHFTPLSDFEPKGATAKAYGVYRDKEGFAERALFVVDGEGIIRWSYVSPVGVNPGADGILKALEKLAKQ
jgi:peroxiredoxin